MSVDSLWPMVVSFITGGALQRVSVWISGALPPLPKDAGFWKTFGYNLLKTVSGLDPSATVIPPKQ